MSVTIQQSPNLWTPIYNPMVFILDSTNTGQSNFKYLADIYISGVTDYVRLAIDADPTYAQGLVDIHRVVESHISSNPGYKTLTGFQKASQSMIAYEVKFGEQYGVASAVTNYPNLTVTGTKYAYNGAYTPVDWNQIPGATIAVEDGGLTLTDQPNARTNTFASTNDQYLHYITNTSGSVYYAEIKTFDSSGSLIQTATILNSYQAVSSYDERRMVFYCGVRALNAASLATGSQPLITSSVYSYTVNFRRFNGSTPLITFVTYTRNHDCLSDRNALTLHWKNYKGGFDSYEFTMINRYKTETKRTQYQRKLGTMTNNAWAYNNYDQSRVNMDSQVQARYELQSNWISLADQDYLSGLIESPEVYIDDGTDMIAVNVISPTSYETKSVSLGDIELNTIKVVVELSMDFWKQRG